MSVLPPKGKLVTRRPSLKGVLMQDVSQGAERVRAWPKKRGKGVDAAQKERMEWFRQAQWAAKYCDPRMIQTFAEATKGTPLLPRDLMTMMLAGRWLEFTMPDGRVITSVQSKQDVSRSLDVLGSGVGYTLVRGEEYWEFQPIPVGGRYGAKVRRTTTLAGGAASTPVLVTYTTEVLDQAAYWTIAEPSKFTVPVQGWYQVAYQGRRNPQTQPAADFQIRVNGVEVQRIRGDSGGAASTVLAATTALVYLNAGDYVQTYVIPLATGAVFTDLEMTIVGPS